MKNKKYLAVHSLQDVSLVSILVRSEIDNSVTTLTDLLLQLNDTVTHLQSTENLGLSSLISGCSGRSSGRSSSITTDLDRDHFLQLLHVYLEVRKIWTKPK